jgi:hypothetical protein
MKILFSEFHHRTNLTAPLFVIWSPKTKLQTKNFDRSTGGYIQIKSRSRQLIESLLNFICGFFFITSAADDVSSLSADYHPQWFNLHLKSVIIILSG